MEGSIIYYQSHIIPRHLGWDGGVIGVLLRLKEGGVKDCDRESILEMKEIALVLLGFKDKYDLFIQELIRLRQLFIEEMWSSYESAGITRTVSSARQD